MAPVSTCSAEGPCARHEPKLQSGKPGKGGPAVFAFPMPKASAPKLHQRNGGFEVRSKKALRRRWGHRRAAADFFGASSVASALGIRSGRDPETDKRRARSSHARTGIAAEVSAPDAEDLGLHQVRNEEPPQGGTWYSSAACRPLLRSEPRRRDPGCPRSGRDPLRIGFRLRQGGKAPRVRLLSYVTQRSPFRLLC